MTIVAGFVNRDGILMCGDTRFESGYAKGSGAKIRTIRGDWGVGLIGFSGTVEYALAALQKFERTLHGVQPEDIFEEFEKALDYEWARKIFVHPLIGQQAGPTYQLLVALRPEGEEPKLYVTHEATIREVAYKSIGIGSDVADHLLKYLHYGNSEERKVLVIASYMLAKVKKLVVGCDDLSMFWALRKEGEPVSYFGEALPRHIEAVTEEFDRDIGLFLRALFDDSEEHFNANLKYLVGRMTAIRKRWFEVQKQGIPTTIDEVPRAQ